MLRTFPQNPKLCEAKNFFELWATMRHSSSNFACCYASSCHGAPWSHHASNSIWKGLLYLVRISHIFTFPHSPHSHISRISHISTFPHSHIFHISHISTFFTLLKTPCLYPPHSAVWHTGCCHRVGGLGIQESRHG